MGKTRKVPVRKCVGCGERKEKRELIRVLRTPEGQITLDETGRANGRGAYLCRKSECLKKALRSKGIERSLQTAIPEELQETLEKEMSAIAQE